MVPDPVTPVRVGSGGAAGPTRGQAAGRGWRRTSHGLHVPAGTPPSTVQRIVEQVARLGPEGVVTGWAALHLLGGSRWFDGLSAAGEELAVALASPDRQLRPVTGAVVRRSRVPPDQRAVVAGVPCAAPEWALFDLMRDSADDDAVVAADLAFLSELTARSRMAGHLARRTGHRGLWRVQDALARSDERSWSPGETRLRLLWHGVPELGPPRCNPPVFDLAGRLLGYPDLLDPRTGLAADYDGADHLQERHRARDLEREARLRDHGLEYVVFVAADVHHPARVHARLRQGQHRAVARLDEPRRWTLTPPPWWIPPEHDLGLDVRLARRSPG